MTPTQRTIILHGTLDGPIWQPGFDHCQVPLTVDLTRESKRIVNGTGTGLIDGLLLAIAENDGDFRFARLTADSFVSIEHLFWTRGTRTKRTRIVEVTELPSIAAYVDVDAFTFGSED